MKYNPLPRLGNQLWAMLFVPFLVALISCNSNNADTQYGINAEDTVTLTEEQKRLPENALRGLRVTKGLTVEVVATEPMLKNPTNIDVDERGRIWVAEAYNYRPGKESIINPEGDRIIILEDTNGDGKADTTKVFYQGPEMNAPLGVCVLGNRVLVSQSPYVWAFYDDDGDDKADRKEILFEGISGVQHDHGMHTFTFGPDGKLYFNFGNEGKTLKDKNGKTVLDQDGDEIGPKKYRQGMVFRCNPDGSQVECLGHNFRNNYEVAVDSYGTMWQSDNDDDGNKGVRINYVMDYGNYGFTDEMTGAGWSASRTNMEDSIPFRHWHLNDPGVVPNLLQTGSGSPTGMVIYEGTLLPDSFQNQMIHCEPGHNVVRSYPVTKDGAGYTARIINIAENAKDKWFRPSDVCVAPDGSLIVSDWYDPGVGGHAMGDKDRGRIYRIAPSNTPYKVPSFDYVSSSGAIAALQNPNLAVRRRAWLTLQEMGDKAVPELEKLWNNAAANPRMRARAFWVLVKMKSGEKYIEQAIKSDNADFRIMGLRAARQLNADVLGMVTKLVNDNDPQVRRECALALRHNKAPEVAALWTQLALQYDGKDRWYLEALGIGADKQWDRFFEAYAQKKQDAAQTSKGKDIIWRARSKTTLPLLAALAMDESTDWKSRQRYFRAFDFNTDPLKTSLLLKMLEENQSKDLRLDVLLLHHLTPADVQKSSVARKALQLVLDSVYGSKSFLELVAQYNLTGEKPRLLKLVTDKAGEDMAANAMKLYLSYGGEKTVKGILAGKDTARSNKLLLSMGRAGNTAMEILKTVVTTPAYGLSQRLIAADQLGKNWVGMMHGMEMLRKKQIQEELVPAFVNGLLPDRTPQNILEEAAAFLPGASKDSTAKKAFDKNEVLALKGNTEKGKAIFSTHCAICHQVKGEGIDFGPKLSEIGDKLPKEALLEAIVNPSAGISFGFENWEITMKDGNVLMGIVSSRSESELELKYPGGKSEKLKLADIKSQKKSATSVMPALHQAMLVQELADLLEYLSSLKK
ncbi:MAG: c-type cytochrome [Chitinophagaceae bacterium]|nr:c-type cytochrome [Chitinophagaceae bacterium]